MKNPMSNPVQNPACPQCGGEGGYLGNLGAWEWFRCIQCGWEFSPAAKRKRKSPRRRRGGFSEASHYLTEMNPKGVGRQLCVHCGKPSIPGLKKGQGLCQYHYTVWMFGKEWADEVRASWKPEPKTNPSKPLPTGTITLQTRDGDVSVEASFVNGLAIHEAPGEWSSIGFRPWTVSHAQTGLKIAGEFATKEEAIRVARIMAKGLPGFYGQTKEQIMGDPRRVQAQKYAVKYRKELTLPKYDIDKFLQRVHVGTPFEDVERSIRAKFSRAPWHLKGKVMDAAVQYAMKRHGEHREIYSWVTGEV